MKMLVTGLFAAIVLMFAIPSHSSAQNKRVAFGEWTTNTVAATPVKVYPVTMFVTRVTIIGKKAARTSNAGTVYVGVTSGNDTQTFPIAPNGECIIESAPFTEFNLASWYLDVTVDNDGVIVIMQ